MHVRAYYQLMEGSLSFQSSAVMTSSITASDGAARWFAHKTEINNDAAIFVTQKIN